MAVRENVGPPKSRSSAGTIRYPKVVVTQTVSLAQSYMPKYGRVAAQLLRVAVQSAGAPNGSSRVVPGTDARSTAKLRQKDRTDILSTTA